MARPDDYARAIRDALNGGSVPCGIGMMPTGRGWPNDSTVGGTFLPYARLDFDAGTALPLSAAQRNEWFDFLFNIAAIGETAEQALQYAGRAREVLLTATLTISGQVVHRIVQVAAQTARQDLQTTPRLSVATAQYRLSASPA